MVIVWGLETASLSKSLRRALDRCQVQMFARMAQLRRHWPHETWLDFYKKRFATGRWIGQQHGFLLSDRLLLKQYSWAGHLARFEDRWAKKVTVWKGCHWKSRGQHNVHWKAYDFEYRWAFRGTRNRIELFWEN